MQLEQLLRGVDVTTEVDYAASQWVVAARGVLKLCMLALRRHAEGVRRTAGILCRCSLVAWGLEYWRSATAELMSLSDISAYLSGGLIERGAQMCF